jgi:hypothetical protein
MIRQDYLMRQIEALAAVLAHLLFLKRSGNLASAGLEIKVACRKLVGMDSDTMLALPDETLLSAMLASGRHEDAVRCLMAGTLLHEQAQLNQALDQTELARAGSRKALILLIAALLVEKDLRTEENHALIATLRNLVPVSEMSPASQQYLLLYQKMLQQSTLHP